MAKDINKEQNQNMYQIINNPFGIVYLFPNPAIPCLVKIGMTTRDNVEAHMKELYGTGVPAPFECQYACKVAVSDCAKIEKALHTAFAPDRINANREFFSIYPEQADLTHVRSDFQAHRTIKSNLTVQNDDLAQYSGKL